MVAETHLRAITGSDIVKFQGLLGRDFERAESYLKASVAEEKVYRSISELCNDGEIDFAILTTPPNARMPILRRLVQAGIPVLMEKPIERTLAAAQAIADLHDAADIPAGIVFQHRARKSSQALKAMVSDGLIGDLVAGEIRVPWWRDQSYYDAPGRGTYQRDGGGVMINQAIHMLDIAVWIMGPVTSVSATMATTLMHSMEAENWAGGVLQFASGAMATLMATTSFYPGGAESIRIQGTKAHAHLEGGILTVSYLDGQTQVIGNSSDGSGGGADPMAFNHIWHQRVIEDFAECVQNGRPPLCSVRDGLQVHSVIDAMERSSRARHVMDLASHD